MSELDRILGYDRTDIPAQPSREDVLRYRQEDAYQLVMQQLHTQRLSVVGLIMSAGDTVLLALSDGTLLCKEPHQEFRVVSMPEDIAKAIAHHVTHNMGKKS